MTASQSVAETLRSAAELLKGMAGAATPGPWEHPVDLDVTRGYQRSGNMHVATWIANCNAGDGDMTEETAEANAEWIAAMHPGTGLALADLLESFVSCSCDEDGDHWAEKSAALRLARLVLGETEEAAPCLT